ncbi:hypothetical protein [Thermoflexus sp.]|uniref:hypothetical protein n=1 Tax=Thermoflexus sp. TaxID=1969742 RepID=UPI0025CEDDCA|nr:hypothetical protein [Thermoflexus sp.]MCS6962588.1 hypothetical protein [Thermoflexus sp.]MCX7690200.1 hypothetical protein [Thermoflexus sp.]MDW8183724.1 hypothetical protein [Anaerolineae bacterium]
MPWAGDGRSESLPFPVEEESLPSQAGRKGKVFLALFGGLLGLGLCVIFGLAIFGAPWTPRWLDTGIPPDRLSEGIPFPITLSDRSGRIYPLILVRTGAQIRAFPMQPPGISCLLKIEGAELIAECIGCRFTADGRPIAGPCASPLPAHPVQTMGGSVWVDVNRLR